MAIKPKTGLGRGLDSIFLDNTAPETAGGNTILRISNIQPRKDQPRRVFDEESLRQLSDSIATYGLIEPVAVREAPGGFYELIAGERRWRAAKLAGLSEIPAVIISADDRKAAEMALIENVQREDLNPVEEAQAYKKLIADYDLTQEQVAGAVGKSRSAIANTMRLLDLPAKCLELLSSGALSEGHAKVLMALKDEKATVDAAELVVAQQLSVRETENLVKKLQKQAELDDEEQADTPAGPIRVNYTRVLEDKAARLLGRRVSIKGRGKTKRLELSFEDKEDLETLLAVLCGNQLFEDEI